MFKYLSVIQEIPILVCLQNIYKQLENSVFTQFRTDTNLDGII